MPTPLVRSPLGERRSKPHDIVYLAVVADSPGFTVTGTWDPLGMRGAVSRTLVLDNVFVPEERAIMPQGAYFAAAVHWPHTYMTIASP